MRIHRRLISIAAGAVLVGLLPGIAAANTTEAIAGTAGMTLTIPGVPLTVTVELDEFGNIDAVSIDDAGSVATSTEDHKVRFTRDNTDGTTTIKVKAKGSKLSVKLKTSNLGDVLGTNIWTGDVFGTGENSTVTFEVAAATSPDGDYGKITSVSVDSNYDYEIRGPYTEVEHDGEEYESKAKIEFSFDGYKMTLKIEVETEFETEFGDDDDDAHVTLKVELKGKDKRELFGNKALGEHTWQGLLCDGTTASVTYTVTADGVTRGEITVAAGASADVDEKDDGFKIRFTDTEGADDAYLKVELEDEHGTLELKVKSKTTKSCDDDDDHDDEEDKKKDDDDDDDEDEDEDEDGDDD